MNKIVYVVLLGLAFLISCDKKLDIDSPEETQMELYEDEGIVVLPGGESSSTRVAVVGGTVVPSLFKAEWIVGDKLLFLFEQKNAQGETIILPQWIGGKVRTIMSVDANNPARGDFTWGVPVGIDYTKPYDMYVFYGTKEVTATNNVPSVTLEGVKDFVPYQLGTRVTNLNPPIRSAKTTVYPKGSPQRPGDTKPNFIFEHIGSLQIIEIVNTSDTETTGTFRFDLQNPPVATDPLTGASWGKWYYPKEVTYNPVTNLVTPNYSSGDVAESPAITIAANGGKSYLINWMNVRRSDDILSYLVTEADGSKTVDNSVKRPAVNMVFTPTGGEAVLAHSSELAERTVPFYPSRAYYYRLIWDGKNLILVSDWEVLPWETVENSIDLTNE